jgi:hypothetical protein
MGVSELGAAGRVRGVWRERVQQVRLAECSRLVCRRGAGSGWGQLVLVMSAGVQQGGLSAAASYNAPSVSLLGPVMALQQGDVTRHTSNVTPHTSHDTRHTTHVTRHTSHVTRHTTHVTRQTSHLTRHTSHLTPHTSHITRHTSHLTYYRHTIHFQCLVLPLTHCHNFQPSSASRHT